jgi:hypothetical protein
MASDNNPDYKDLISFMKHLRSYFIKTYPLDYVTGSLYSAENSITYFSFTPKSLKEQKLKIAIVFNHQNLRFEVWLTGQNKQIQKKYWEEFKNSDWNKYHIPTDIDKGFSIVDNVLIETPDFKERKRLTEQIESKTMEFINEMIEVFE